MPNRAKVQLKRHAYTVTAVYLVVGILWIIFSDRLIVLLFDEAFYERAQSLKGIFFVAVTGFLLYLLINLKNESIADLFDKTRRSMKKFEETFEQAPVGIAHMSADENWILVNRKLCDILEYDRSELKTLSLDRFVHDEDLEPGRDRDRRLINKEIDSYVMEKRYIKNNGKTVHARLSKSAVFQKNGELDYLIAIVEDISRQKKAERKLNASLREKEVLLSEIHHRVKNNLAVISGLLELQAYNTTDVKVRELLQNCTMRIKSMALIHESFYQEKELSQISFDRYAKEFVGYVQEAFSDLEKEITIELSIEPIKLNINQAVPCGLILNELLINAHKHAFNEKQNGIIQIEMTRESEDITLTVRDNGTGLPDDFDPDTPTSLGMTIINALTKQLDASLDISSDQTGSRFTITFRQQPKQRGSASSFV